MVARFGVLTAVTIKITLFLDVTQCSLIYRYKCFGGTCCLHLQGTLKIIIRAFLPSRQTVCLPIRLAIYETRSEGWQVSGLVLRMAVNQTARNRRSANCHFYK
jgi:hypothetical protein